jgi:hypothetical protein
VEDLAAAFFHEDTGHARLAAASAVVPGSDHRVRSPAPWVAERCAGVHHRHRPSAS